MAITITRAENRAVLYGASFATHTFNVDIGDIVINNADDNKISDYAPTPSYGLVKYNTSANGRTWLIDGFDIKFYMLGTMIRRTDYSRGSWQIYTPANVEAQLPVSPNSTYWTYANRKPSYYFNSTTKTTLSIPITYRLAYWAVQTGSDATGTIAQGYDNSESGDLGTFYLRLNVPPTFDNTALSIDTATAYTNVTTASVTVSNATAYYGGDISSATLTIGNQTASISGNGTISILLNAGGTFTPTLSVTDSRGQVATKMLDPITVNVYTAPSVSFDADRTTATGVLDDEGAYATIDATFTFADVIASLQAPTITATDEDGVQTTPTVTWYSSRGADGTLSGSVTWSSLSSGDTVHALLSITGGFNTQKSYQISVTPEDSESAGTPITQTLPTAFYTLDFLAGGHGIAFGKPAINTGFECAMDATFEDTLTAQDMTQQEIEDFVDSLNIQSRASGMVEFKTLLWTNTQGAQSSYSILVDTSEYDYLDVEIERYGNIQTARIPTTATSGEIYAMYDSYQTVRTFTLSSTTLTFNNGAYYGGYLQSTNKVYGTGYCLPSKVYGIKNVEV